MIPFGPWLPDQPTFRPEVAFDVLNVIPHEGGYHPWHSWNSAIPAPDVGQNPLAMQYFISPSGVIYNILGTPNKLYKLNAAGVIFDDATRLAGGDYSTPSEGAWFHTQYDDIIFWANGADVVQKFDLVGGTNFVDAAYPAGPPICKYLATVRRFAVAASTVNNNSEVVWSGLGDPISWAPDPVTLADSQILPTGGDITGLVGGDYGVVFQQHSLQRMVFAGPPTAFEFEKISMVLGCNAPRSISQYGNVVFFLSTSGVKMMRGAQEIADIGEGKIDTWLNDNIDAVDLWRCTATIDIRNKLYLLSVPVDDAQDLCDLILAYHWPTGEWSKIGFVTHLVCQMITQSSYNLDNVDDLLGNLDATDVSVDSPEFISTGDLHISAFNIDRALGHFSGDLMPAMMVTGDIPISPGKKSLIRSIRPMFQGDVIDLTVTPYVRDQLQQSPVPKATAQVNRNGKCPLKANGRYHRFQANTAFGGSWEYALGFDDPVISEMAP